MVFTSCLVLCVCAVCLIGGFVYLVCLIRLFVYIVCFDGCFGGWLG